MGPQTKAIIWNAIFTFILLVVTGTYAWFTQSMADTMTSQLNLSLEQHRPYIFFEKFEFEPEKFGGLQYMVVVKNSGSVPAKVKLEKFCIDNEDNCSDKLGYLYIFPNSGGSNLGALGDAEEVKESIRENGDIKLIIKLKYWPINDDSQDPYIYEAKIRIFKDNESPPNFLHENMEILAN